MVYYFKKGKNATEMQKKDLCSVWRRCWDWPSQRWFAELCAGDFSLDDVPQSGRAAEVDSYQIKTIIENDLLYTTWEIANIFKISRSIKLLMKMKNVSFILQKNPNRFFGLPNRTADHLLII